MNEILIETLLIIIGFMCCIAGIIGSFLPILPGPSISWVGLLMIYLMPSIDFDYTFLGVTLGIAILLLVTDYIIPIIGAKYFGGSKSGTIGSTIGLVVGLFFPPLGFVIGPFIGAFLGELFFNTQSNTKHALKSAVGSFIGFLASTFMKALIAIVYAGLFVYKLVAYWDVIY